MKNKVGKLITTLFLSVFLLPIFTLGVYATDTSTLSTAPTETVSGEQSLPTTTPTISTPVVSEDVSGNYVMDSQLSNVSAEKVTNWANTKGFDVVKLMQTIIQPLAIVVFIAGGIVAMFGSFGHGGAGKGILIIAISVLVYTGALFAPEILQLFSQWLSS